MERFGLARIAAAVPPVQVADPRANADHVLALIKQAAESRVDLVLFPELCLTGYTCGDLFHQSTLLESAAVELARLAHFSSESFSGVIIVGLPIAAPGGVFNCAAVIANGAVLGLVPKSFLPNYKEFYERRYFQPASAARVDAVSVPGFAREIPFGADQLFAATDFPEFVLGVEICEDVWVPEPPSGRQALAGATVLCNPSASDELVGKVEYRRQLVLNQSARCLAAYVYSGSGPTESTTDLVFGGHGLIAEAGMMVAEGPRFSRQPVLTVADIDLERLRADRFRQGTFADAPPRAAFRVQPFRLGRGPDWTTEPLRRSVPARPFVPSDPQTRADRCEEIFQIQSAGLSKRLEVAKPPRLNIGVSGGLDSTLALLVAVRACELVGRPHQDLAGLTMPGFGTSAHTRANADRLMQLLGISRETIDIRALCVSVFHSLGHKPFGLDVDGLSLEEFAAKLSRLPSERRSDLVFENVQARVRTLLLMSRGFVVGTGDLSELALGWCTYNGDHMSMYNPNAGVPKTLIQFLVRWVAEHVFDGSTREVLLSIAATEISPELLPIDAAGIQSTEQTIGPYELHDFFLYHVLRFGFGPRKILLLAQHASFSRAYTPDEVRRWLTVFLRRFFANQFKRSCIPDGPKVGSVSLSPRGDWRMPSDATADAWLRELATNPS